MVTPLYAKPGVQGQIQWFQELMNTVTKPVMLYNVPRRTGTSLQREALKILKDHPNFGRSKKPVVQPKNLRNTSKRYLHHPYLAVMMECFLEYAVIGAKGLVSVASNVRPEKTNLYVKRTLGGDLTNPEDWKKWSDTLFIASNPIPVKRMMYETGTINSPVCRAPLTHEEITDAQVLNNINNDVTGWE